MWVHVWFALGLVGRVKKLHWLMMTFDRWCELWGRGREGKGWGWGGRAGLAAGWLEDAWRRVREREREREREGEEKTGKQSEGNSLQASVKQRERKAAEKRGEGGWTKGTGTCKVMCQWKKKKKGRQWGGDLSTKTLQHTVTSFLTAYQREAESLPNKKKQRHLCWKCITRDFSVCVRVWELVCIQHWQTGREVWMSEEGAPHTLSLAHAESQTHTSASSSTHTGGPMQLQATTDSEEKKVSTLMLRASSLFFFFGHSSKALQKLELQRLFFFFIWHSADFAVTASWVVPARVTAQCTPHCWNSTPSKVLCVAGDWSNAVKKKKKETKERMKAWKIRSREEGTWKKDKDKRGCLGACAGRCLLVLCVNKRHESVWLFGPWGAVDITAEWCWSLWFKSSQSCHHTETAPNWHESPQKITHHLLSRLRDWNWFNRELWLYVIGPCDWARFGKSLCSYITACCSYFMRTCFGERLSEAMWAAVQRALLAAGLCF